MYAYLDSERGDCAMQSTSAFGSGCFSRKWSRMFRRLSHQRLVSTSWCSNCMWLPHIRALCGPSKRSPCWADRVWFASSQLSVSGQAAIGFNHSNDKPAKVGQRIPRDAFSSPHISARQLEIVCFSHALRLESLMHVLVSLPTMHQSLQTHADEWVAAVIWTAFCNPTSSSLNEQLILGQIFECVGFSTNGLLMKGFPPTSEFETSDFSTFLLCELALSFVLWRCNHY